MHRQRPNDPHTTPHPFWWTTIILSRTCAPARCLSSHGREVGGADMALVILPNISVLVSIWMETLFYGMCFGSTAFLLFPDATGCVPRRHVRGAVLQLGVCVGSYPEEAHPRLGHPNGIVFNVSEQLLRQTA